MTKLDFIETLNDKLSGLPEDDIFRPAVWNAFGMNKEDADYRACTTFGPQFKK